MDPQLAQGALCSMLPVCPASYNTVFSLTKLHPCSRTPAVLTVPHALVLPVAATHRLEDFECELPELPLLHHLQQARLVH